MEGTEDIADLVLLKRHEKMEKEEKQRKRSVLGQNSARTLTLLNVNLVQVGHAEDEAGAAAAEAEGQTGEAASSSD